MGHCTVNEVMQLVDEFAPPYLAMERDAIGLQIGRAEKTVKKIWIALDPSPPVIQSAVENDIDMLITHHALIYKPLTAIRTETAKGGSIARALQHDMAIYVAHTNLDIAKAGVNETLANQFGLQQIEILDETYQDELRKLVVFIPFEHVDKVREAICNAGAGFIGKYSHCTFSGQGEGTFKPHPGANPFIGQVGNFTRVNEVRLETIVLKSQISNVISAMLASHPYEEVAYDVYPIDLPGVSYGIGRIGNLVHPMPLRKFAQFVKESLGLSGIRFGGNENQMVQRIAVLGGAGSDWTEQAIKKGAHVLVTSDCDHHDVGEAWQDGLAMIDATHASLEHPVLPVLCNFLRKRLPLDVHVNVCDLKDDPFHFL